jgi:hypothetical protein
MLEKKTVCDKVEVVNMDTIPMLQCREATWVEEDGVMIGGKQYHRHVISPSDDVSNEPAEVQAFAAALFTDEVKAAYAAKQAQETI